MTPQTQPNKTLGQTVSDLLANVLVKPVRNLVAWGKKNAATAVAVTAILGAGTAVSVKYLGEDNSLEKMIQQEQAAASVDPSGTTVEAPASVEP